MLTVYQLTTIDIMYHTFINLMFDSKLIKKNNNNKLITLN